MPIRFKKEQFACGSVSHDKRGMNMGRNGDSQDNMLRHEIRRQFNAPATARFLNALPTFRVDTSIPDRFDRLLNELERCESERSNRD